LPDPSGAESRLALLRRRWEGEHSASAFLPLAEEFRRIGRLREAVEVLESGLRAFPWHTSAQVAMGRCRLEAGDVAGAVAALENIVRQDPTHLVASKLLVEAYLRSGRPAEAGAQLDAYAALNERDPEIERLRARLGGAAPPADIFRLPVPEVPVPDLSALPAPRRPLEPFPGLGGARARRRYLEGLAGEGIFRLRLRQVAPPPAPAAPPPAAAEAAPTVTLGELYLQQGHAGEAEGIFNHVLGLEPDNRRAQRGLEEARVAAAAPAGRAGRKVRALRAYLERLRRGAQHVS
jgi:predicted Zn-dependent protease